jgi:hypothetical protein
MASKGRMTWQRLGFESHDEYVTWCTRVWKELDARGARKEAERLGQPAPAKYVRYVE